MSSRKVQQGFVWVLGIGLLLAAGPAWAQEGSGEIGEGEGDYRNHTLTIPPDLDFSGWYYVGADGSNNVITINDGGKMTQTRAASDVSLVIGRNLGSDHNKIVVNQGGLLHHETTQPHLIRIGGRTGAGGSYNELVVNGGSVTNFGIFVGNADNATGNVLRVTNGGLVDSSDFIIVGSRSGSVGNQVLVSGGTNSRVKAAAYFSAGNVANSHDNEVRVEEGSIEVGSYSRIGRYGTNNVLLVSSGGSYTVGTDLGASSRWLRLGEDASAEHNRITVDGDGSRLTALSDMEVGVAGSFNTFRADNEAEVTVGNDLVVGVSADAVGNQVVITNSAQATVSNQVIIGSSGSGNVLTVTEGGSLSAGASVGIIIGNEHGADSNRVIVSSGGVLDNTSGAGELRIGGSGTTGGSYSEVLVDGGTVTNMRIRLGDGGTSTGNVMQVVNGGRVHAPGYIIVAPRAGSVENMLLVSGATSRVVTEGYFSLGNHVNSPNNVVRVEEGALLDVSTTSYVGRHSSNNWMLVSGGGTWEMGGNLIVGETAGASTNRLDIDGTGSSVSVGGLISVGRSGPGNIVTVTDGGILSGGSDTGIYVGEEDGSDYNQLIVGPGGTVTSTADGDHRGLRVGGSGDEGGSNNEVLVDGGVITNLVIRLGDGTGSTGNVMQVVNGGRVYSPSYVIVAPRAGTEHNELVVSGATSRVEAGSYFSLGNVATSPNNITRIRDEGALETDTFAWVGRASTNNRMFVSAEGTLDVGTTLHVGQSVGADGTLLEVDGAGSRISAGGDVTVGVSDRNILRVQNQGLLRTAADATIGVGTAADNEVIVTGTGSLWTNAGAIAISPDGGADNALRVRDAGLVLSGSLGVGANGELEIDDATAGVADTLMVDAGGQLTLSGSGSKIQVGAGAMTVDNNFSANRLLVSDGGTVTANGALDLGTGGLMVVDDGGTVGGAGTILGNADVSGALRPGNSAGTLTFDGTLTLQDGAAIYLELGGEGIGESDLIVANAILLALNDNVTLYFSLLEGYEPTVNDTIQVFVADPSGVAGSFDVDYVGDMGGWTVNTDNLLTDGTVTMIPEPSTVTLLVLFAAGFVLRRRLHRA